MIYRSIDILTEEHQNGTRSNACGSPGLVARHFVQAAGDCIHNSEDCASDQQSLVIRPLFSVSIG
jgi:hypothetical protein